ncbi:hypothetical protein EDD17DRAFT_1116095 [Pisolithus thermaeus]|nr:hypothetical protein EDD17DRAFT_1116095 [Pisolithus thermaeus]
MVFNFSVYIFLFFSKALSTFCATLGGHYYALLDWRNNEELLQMHRARLDSHMQAIRIRDPHVPDRQECGEEHFRVLPTHHDRRGQVPLNSGEAGEDGALAETDTRSSNRRCLCRDLRFPAVLEVDNRSRVGSALLDQRRQKAVFEGYGDFNVRCSSLTRIEIEFGGDGRRSGVCAHSYNGTLLSPLVLRRVEFFIHL